MADELQTLTAHAHAVAESGARLGRTFASELARVLRDADLALRDVVVGALGKSRAKQLQAARGLALRNQIRTALRDAGYDRLAQAAASAGLDAQLAAVTAGGVGARAARFAATAVGARRIAALQAIAQLNLLHVADEVAIALWRSLAQTVLTTRPVADILDDLVEALDDEAHVIETLYDTQVSMFGRQVEALATADDGPAQAFLYVGPDDRKTRPFCRAHVDRVWTRAAIDAMDNGQGLDVFLTGGGYNCRHSFLAVESEALVALADTGFQVSVSEVAA